jgi:uncharacterized protein (TIGR00725 family)
MEIYKPKYKICISGAAETGHCSSTAFENTMELGREVAKNNCVLVTGATTGAPYWAAKGAKEEGGIVLGLSPAASYVAHIKSYRLPVDYHDFIIYTGSNYSGRNLQLTRTSDAVIVSCGRMGTLNEFTIAFEDNKIIGVLEGSGGTADSIKEIVANAHRGPGRIVYNSDPKELVKQVVEMIKEEYEEYEK